MIDLPTNAEVYCADGIAGRTRYIIGNPVNCQITHLVVEGLLPPFHKTLVPVDQVEETTPIRIMLKCTREDLNRMDPFEYEEYIRTELPGYLHWEDVPAIPGFTTEPVTSFIPVKHRNIPQDETALRRGARVEASDSYMGKVGELLIDPKDMHVTHIVLMERHIVQGKEITIPVSQIDHIAEDTVYLKLDRQSIEELPSTPVKRWSK